MLGAVDIIEGARIILIILTTVAMKVFLRSFASSTEPFDAKGAGPSAGAFTLITFLVLSVAFRVFNWEHLNPYLEHRNATRHGGSVVNASRNGSGNGSKRRNWVWVSKLIEALSEETHGWRQVVHDLHDFKLAYRLIRENHRNAKFSWQNVSESINKGSHGGEKFCALYRDNWSCAGAAYENFLNRARPYNRSLGMGALKENSRMLIMGNSIMGQLGMTIICNTVGVVVWRLGITNNMVAHHPKNNATIMLFSNFEPEVMPNAMRTLALVKKVGYTPDHTLSGYHNYWGNHKYWGNNSVRKCRALEKRQAILESFPKTDYLEFLNYPETFAVDNKSSCCADFHHCKQTGVIGSSCHGCVPGTTNVASERVVQLLMESGEQSPIRRFDDDFISPAKFKFVEKENKTKCVNEEE